MTGARRPPGQRIHPLVIPLADLLTFNLYFPLWLYARYGEIRRADPEATRITPGRAVGCLFIPLFNLFWLPYVLVDLARALGRLQVRLLGRTLIWPHAVTILVLAGTFLGGVGGIAFLYSSTFLVGAPLPSRLAVAALFTGVIGLPVWAGMLVAQMSLNRVWSHYVSPAATRGTSRDDAAWRHERRQLFAALGCLALLSFLPIALASEGGRLLAILPGRAVRLGLAFVHDADRPVAQPEIDHSLQVLRARLDAMAIDSPQVVTSRAAGEDIAVLLPPARDLEHVVRALACAGKFEFQPLGRGTSVPYASLQAARAAVESLPGGFEAHALLCYREWPAAPGDAAPEGWVVTERASIVTGRDLQEARPAPSDDGGYRVDLELAPAGAERLAAWSREHVGERLAIVLDGEARSAPVVRDPLGARGQITGRFSFESAQELALVLRSGALSYPLRVASWQSMPPRPWLLEHGMRTGALIVALLFAVLALYRLGRLSPLGEELQRDRLTRRLHDVASSSARVEEVTHGHVRG